MMHQEEASISVSAAPAIIPRAMGRSKPGPCFLKSAGARLTTKMPCWKGSPLFWMAVSTRWPLSFTAVSGRPTIKMRFSAMGRKSTSTSTSMPSTPRTVEEYSRVIISPC